MEHELECAAILSCRKKEVTSGQYRMSGMIGPEVLGGVCR